MNDNPTPRPEGLDGLLDFVAERLDPLRAAQDLRAVLSDEDFNALVFGGETVSRLLARLKWYEEYEPSWAHGSPEDYDNWLRRLVPDDRRLMLYQWVGGQAVREALGEFRDNLRNDPAPREYRHYDQDTVEELLEVIDPAKDGGPFPSVLPLGRPFCDVSHHSHPDGGGRLPSCHLDSPE